MEVCGAAVATLLMVCRAALVSIQCVHISIEIHCPLQYNTHTHTLCSSHLLVLLNMVTSLKDPLHLNI